MTNADLPLIRELYEGFNIFGLSVTRFVSCKGARYKVGELVVTNYEKTEARQMEPLNAN
jgi:hypothetical protein